MSGPAYWMEDERELAYLRECHDAETERMEADMDEQAKHLPFPLPQLSPIGALIEKFGMDPRDPEQPLPKAA